MGNRTEGYRHNCRQLHVGGSDVRVIWHPEKERELVMFVFKTSNIYTYDALSMKPVLISFEEEPELYSRYNDLFSPEMDERFVIAVDGGRRLFRIFHFVWIEADTTGDRWIYSVPVSSSVRWLADGNHLLVKGRDRLEVLEVDTGKLTPFLYEDGIREKKVVLSNSFFDIEM
jgi:hypothetical protein